MTTTYFVESSTTGRFHRNYPIKENDGKGDNDKNSTSFSTTFHRYVIITFLFLQGILSGLCLSAFSNNGFEVSSQTTTEQYFFFATTCCLFGSWYMLHQDVITQLLERNSLENVSKSLVAKNLIFFLAFIFTYLCINVVYSGTVDEPRYCNFAVTRSVLCILGWLISCYRFVLSRNNNTIQHDE